jgi:glycerol-3-phosphate acyltransferase PlsY
LIDFLKGVLAIILVSQIYESDFYLIRLAAVFVVIGHNYNAFLAFKGGRGLSTAAGVFVMINPISAITWIIMYFTTKKIIRDNVHVGILGGCIGSSVLVLGFPELGFKALATIDTFEILPFKILHFVISFVIISKLVKPLRELYGTENSER